MQQCSVIVVGSKADLLEQKKELPAISKALGEITREHNLQPPIVLSSHKLTNVSALKKTISKSAQFILKSPSRDIPSSYLFFMEGLTSSKDLIVKSTFPDQVQMFFNDLGEIVFDKDSGKSDN